MDVLFELLGDDFDVDAALAGSPLRECATIWRRGEVIGRKHGICKNSSLNIWVGGDNDTELEQQITEALEFLRTEAQEIHRLRKLPGVEVGRLRFGELWREGIVARSPCLPAGLLLACGELGIDIVLCQYLTAESREEDSKPI